MPTTNAFRLFLAACLGAVLLTPVAIAADPPGTRDGEIRPTGAGGFLAWDAEGQSWLPRGAPGGTTPPGNRSDPWPTAHGQGAAGASRLLSHDARTEPRPHAPATGHP